MQMGLAVLSIITVCINYSFCYQRSTLDYTGFYTVWHCTEIATQSLGDVVLPCYISHFHRLGANAVCLKSVQTASYSVYLATEPGSN